MTMTWNQFAVAAECDIDKMDLRAAEAVEVDMVLEVRLADMHFGTRTAGRSWEM